MHARTGLMGMLTGFGFGCLLTGCLAILPPVFAQQTPDPLPLEKQSVQPIEEQSVRMSEDERTPLLSLGAILVGISLWSGLRLYQQRVLAKHPERAQNLRRQLLARIARLDDRYAQGRLRESAYRRKRQRLKARALEITLRQYSAL